MSWDAMLDDPPRLPPAGLAVAHGFTAAVKRLAYYGHAVMVRRFYEAGFADGRRYEQDERNHND